MSKPGGHTSPFRVGVVYLGCCIGAGYLSGQELFQFFGSHGVWCIPALLVAMLCIFAVGAVILSLAVDTGETRMDRIVVWFDCKPLRAAVATFEVVFLFMIYTLCVAAFGSFLAQAAGISPVWGELAFCLFCAVLSLFGVRGLVRFFSCLVPPLVAVTVIIASFGIFTSEGIHFFRVEVGGLISGVWGFDALTYAVFTLFCALPVLVPLGATVRDARAARRGALIGAACIGGLALVIMLAILTVPAVTQEPFPMLALALQKSSLAGVVYGILLAVGIFSAGLSSQSAINEYFIQRFRGKKQILIPVTAVVSVIALLLGLLGFEKLIGILYPIFGYIGFLPLMLLLVHAAVFYRNKRRNKKNA